MKKLLALLIAAVLLVAVQPGAAAMPVTPAHSSMSMMDCGSQAIMKCNHCMPMQKHSHPCKDMTSCLGMLNCSMAFVVPVGGYVMVPVAVTRSSSWPLQETGSSLSLRPDNPPPIA